MSGRQRCHYCGNARYVVVYPRPCRPFFDGKRICQPPKGACAEEMAPCPMCEGGFREEFPAKSWTRSPWGEEGFWKNRSDYDIQPLEDPHAMPPPPARERLRELIFSLNFKDVGAGEAPGISPPSGSGDSLADARPLPSVGSDRDWAIPSNPASDLDDTPGFEATARLSMGSVRPVRPMAASGLGEHVPEVTPLQTGPAEVGSHTRSQRERSGREAAFESPRAASVGGASTTFDNIDKTGPAEGREQADAPPGLDVAGGSGSRVGGASTTGGAGGLFD